LENLLNNGLIVSTESRGESFNGRNRDAKAAVVVMLERVPANQGINDLVNFLCSFTLRARRFS